MSPRPPPRSRGVVPLVKHLMRLNTAALAQLWQGREGDAVKLFRRGLLTAKAELQKQQERQHLTTAATPPTFMDDGHAAMAYFYTKSLASVELVDVLGTWDTPCLLLGQPETTSHDGVGGQGGGGFLLYRHVLMVSDCCDAQDLAATTAAILARADTDDDAVAAGWTVAAVYALLAYNLGVIRHETGLARGVVTDLGRARVLYQSALQCLREEAAACSHVVYPAPVRLVLALFSNLGHVAGYFQDYTCAEWCRDGLGETLNYSLNTVLVTPSGQEGGGGALPTTTRLLDVEKDFFKASWERSWNACSDQVAPAA